MEEINKKMSVSKISEYMATAATFTDENGQLLSAQDNAAIMKPIDAAMPIGGISHPIKEINAPDVNSIKLKMKELRTDLIQIRHNVAMNDIYAGSDATMSELWSSNSSFYKARLDETEANLEREMADLRKRKANYEQHESELKEKEAELERTISMFNHYSNDGSMPAYEINSYVQIEQELQDEKAKINSSLVGGIDKVVSLPIYKDEKVDIEDECEEAINKLLHIYHAELPKVRAEHESYSAGLVNHDFEDAADQAMTDKMLFEIKQIVTDNFEILNDPASDEGAIADAKASIETNKAKEKDIYAERRDRSKEHLAKSVTYKTLIAELRQSMSDLKSSMHEAIEHVQACINEGVEIDGVEVDEAYVYNKSAEMFGGALDQKELQLAYKEARDAYVKSSQEYIKTQSEVLLREDIVKAEYIKSNRIVESARRSKVDAESIVENSTAMISKLEKAITLHETTIDFANHEIASFKEESMEISVKIEDSKPSNWDTTLNEDGAPMTIEQKENAHKDYVAKLTVEKEELSEKIDSREHESIKEKKMLSEAKSENDRFMSEMVAAEEKLSTLIGGEEGSIAKLEEDLKESHSKVLEYANVKMEQLNSAESNVTEALVNLETAEQALSELEGTFASDIQFTDRVDELDGEGDLEFIVKGSEKEANPTEIKLPKWLAKLFKNDYSGDLS